MYQLFMEGDEIFAAEFVIDKLYVLKEFTRFPQITKGKSYNHITKKHKAQRL